MLSLPWFHIASISFTEQIHFFLFSFQRRNVSSFDSFQLALCPKFLSACRKEAIPLGLCKRFWVCPSRRECGFPQSPSLAQGSDTEAVEEWQTKFLLRDQTHLPTAFPPPHPTPGSATASHLMPGRMLSSLTQGKRKSHDSLPGQDQARSGHFLT